MSPKLLLITAFVQLLLFVFSFGTVKGQPLAANYQTCATNFRSPICPLLQLKFSSDQYSHRRRVGCQQSRTLFARFAVRSRILQPNDTGVWPLHYLKPTSDTKSVREVLFCIFGSPFQPLRCRQSRWPPF
jgi:hypothetical protein